ncbi:MAG: arsenate reductase ArsC [Chthoniobacterales bacterium]|nr:arsenate reductase ArsC [Chthoniobacterales bacterium]
MDSTKPKFKLLFLCTGNSARSILAEFIMKKIASHKFDVVSAGSNPKPSPHPLALQVLRDQYKLDVTSARSKSWHEFEGVEFDFVITLCDNAKESCPVWPGQPIIAHWPSPDPAEAEGPDAAKVFWQVAQQIQRRLELFASLPFEKLDALRLEAATKEIGQRERLIINTQPIKP